MADSKFLDYFHLKPEDIDAKIHEEYINKIAHICFNDWKNLYPSLGIDTKDIEVIEAEPNTKDMAKSFFRLWKKRNGRDATYRRLIDALIKIKSREEAEGVCEILKSKKESESHGALEGGSMTEENTENSMEAESSISPRGIKRKILDADMEIISWIQGKRIRLDEQHENEMGGDHKIEDCVRLQLNKNLKMIMKSYTAFTSSLLSNVINNDVSVKRLRLFLNDLPVFKDNEHQSPDFLPRDIKVKLEKAECIEDVFLILGDISSYLNYDIFQSILQQFCSNSTDEALNYAEYFKNYIEKHNVQEYFKINPKLEKFCTEESSILIIKLDVAHTTKLSKIINIKACIAEMLDLNPFLLRIVNIEEGCVKVTVHIPTHVAEVLFHRGTTFMANQIEGFKDLSVMHLQCNGYTFDVRDDYIPVASLPPEPCGRLSKRSKLPNMESQFQVQVKKLICFGVEAKDHTLPILTRASIPSIFRSMIYELSRRLTQHDCESIYQSGHMKEGHNHTSLDTLSYLETCGYIGPHKLEFLETLLESIHRMDLLQIVKNYKEEIGEIKKERRKSSFHIGITHYLGNNQSNFLRRSISMTESVPLPEFALIHEEDFLSAMKNFSARVKGSSADQLSSLYMSPRPSSTLLHAQFSEQKTIPNGSQDDSLTLGHICAELKRVSSKWSEIGVQLGIPYYMLKEFQKEDDPLAAAVDYWLNGNVERVPVSWRSIVAALNSTCVWENLLAKRISEKYCQQQVIVDLKDSSCTADSVPSVQTSACSATSLGSMTTDTDHDPNKQSTQSS